MPFMENRSLSWRTKDSDVSREERTSLFAKRAWIHVLFKQFLDTDQTFQIFSDQAQSMLWKIISKLCPKSTIQCVYYTGFFVGALVRTLLYRFQLLWPNRIHEFNILMKCSKFSNKSFSEEEEEKFLRWRHYRQKSNHMPNFDNET